jgi:hypothetical protein
MINMKKGNTKSVGVSPSHNACLKGENTNSQLPGLFTIIIPEIVMPRITSKERSLPDCAIVFEI